MNLFDFAYCRDFDKKIEILKDKAEPENWGDRDKILKNYIHHYFKKIYSEGKINYSEDGNTCIFNTGLMTKNFEDIVCLFIKNRKPNADQEWFMIGFYEISNRKITDTHIEIPDVAKFFEKFEDLYFNPDKEIFVNKEHVLENSPRFPSGYNEDVLMTLLEGAINILKKRIKRNYRLVVPQYYNGNIQFLLPLYLLSYDNPDLVLAVSDEEGTYRGNTVLTLDMAYNNARLLMRPESEWLHP